MSDASLSITQQKIVNFGQEMTEENESVVSLGLDSIPRQDMVLASEKDDSSEDDVFKNDSHETVSDFQRQPSLYE